jgi:Flp pilus assembly pilin Flp
MKSWLLRLARLGTKQEGATAVEYALLVFFIAAVIVSVVLSLGQQVVQLFGINL